MVTEPRVSLFPRTGYELVLLSLSGSTTARTSSDAGDWAEPAGAVREELFVVDWQLVATHPSDR